MVFLSLTNKACQGFTGSPSESVVRDVSLTVSDWGRWRLHPLHSCYLGLRGLPSLHGPPAATLPGLAWFSSGYEVSNRGQWACALRAPPNPAPGVLIPQVGACTDLNAHVPTAFNLAPLDRAFAAVTVTCCAQQAPSAHARCKGRWRAGAKDWF